MPSFLRKPRAAPSPLPRRTTSLPRLTALPLRTSSYDGALAQSFEAADAPAAQAPVSDARRDSNVDLGEVRCGPSLSLSSYVCPSLFVSLFLYFCISLSVACARACISLFRISLYLSRTHTFLSFALRVLASLGVTVGHASAPQVIWDSGRKVLLRTPTFDGHDSAASDDDAPRAVPWAFDDAGLASDGDDAGLATSLCDAAGARITTLVTHTALAHANGRVSLLA